jgi:SanA protein
MGGANALVYYLGHAALVDPTQAEPAEAIVVLGALVFSDGRVSVMVADRLATALELYQAGKAPKILLTGDHGQEEYAPTGV